MPLPGQRSDPIRGIKGGKTRITPRKRLPKLAATPEAEDLQEQSSIYLRERNKQMRAKRLRAEMDLAHARNQLIEKRLVERQLAYLLIGMRQKLLLLPGKMRTKLGENFSHEMVVGAKELVVEALNEVSRLPEATEPEWLKKLSHEEESS
jgi:hypothetical protein